MCLRYLKKFIHGISVQAPNNEFGEHTEQYTTIENPFHMTSKCMMIYKESLTLHWCEYISHNVLRATDTFQK